STSSGDKTKRKSSSASPCPALEPLPAPPPAGGLFIRSPGENSLLPGRTYSRSPPREELRKVGSLVSRDGIGTLCVPSASAILPVRPCSVTARPAPSSARSLTAPPLP